MNISQLRYLLEVSRQKMNISRAANVLCVSQSAISKQIKLLEEELGLILFCRKGRSLVCLSDAGKDVLLNAKAVLQKIDDIYEIASQHNNKSGELAIATTHTQARYVLPFAVERFSVNFPDISLNLQQGTPNDVADKVLNGYADIAIATEVLANENALISLPCYKWGRCIIVKEGHELTRLQHVSLRDIAKYPIITYALGFTARYRIDEAFNNAALHPNIVLTASDADVIKTYVRLGMGVGIIANMAFNGKLDAGLTVLDASHLFGLSTAYIAFMENKYMRRFIYQFIEMFAPHLTEQVVQEAALCQDRAQRLEFLGGLTIPMYSSRAYG